MNDLRRVTWPPHLPPARVKVETRREMSVTSSSSLQQLCQIIDEKFQDILTITTTLEKDRNARIDYSPAPLLPSTHGPALLAKCDEAIVAVTRIKNDIVVDVDSILTDFWEMHGLVVV